MPCMNATSACDRGGSLALVDDGSVLLGCPGAPGCTTTDFCGSLCPAHRVDEKRPAGQKKLAAMVAPTNISRGIADPLAVHAFRLLRKGWSPDFGAQLNIFSLLSSQKAAGVQRFNRRPTMGRNRPIVYHVEGTWRCRVNRVIRDQAEAQTKLFNEARVETPLIFQRAADIGIMSGCWLS